MRAGIVVSVTPEDRRRLEAIVADRSSAQKHVWRAQIILATAEGCGTFEVMRRSGKAKPVIWRWQERFMQEGVDGLLHDKTRPPGKAPLPAETVQRVLDLALGPPPGEATHWTGRMLAKAADVSLRSVQRILEAHQLAPHRIRTFKLSNDAKFADKLRDIVGLYVDPPAHAVVLSVDEKSQIQALDRTQPGLPMKKGRAGTMTHDYKSVTAPPRCLPRSTSSTARSSASNMKRHRHQEFIRFLNAIEAKVPAKKADPCHRRQLCHPQASQGPCLARPPSPLHLPLHAEVGLLAQRRRGLLRQTDPTTIETGRLPIRRRPSGRHQPLRRGNQC